MKDLAEKKRLENLVSSELEEFNECCNRLITVIEEKIMVNSTQVS